MMIRLDRGAGYSRISDQGQPGCNAYAHGNPVPVTVIRVLFAGFDRIDQFQRRTCCPLRVIFMGAWIAEDTHDAVTGEAMGKAVVAVDDLLAQVAVWPG